MDYVSAETALVTWLKAAFLSARVVTETPADLAGNLPCIRVTRFGGPGDTILGFDNPALAFDVFDVDRAAARALAYQVRSSVCDDLPGHVAAPGCTVLQARATSGPFWTPYDNTSLRRFTVTVQFRIRSH